MANLVEVPREDVCICCEREEPPRGRNEIIDEHGEKNYPIYNLVSNFFGVSFDMQDNFGCYVCNLCKMHLQNYFAAKNKLEILIETVNETSQELVPDNGGNWSVSNINICIACSEKSRKKKFIVQSDANLSMRKRKQSRPPPKPGEAYKSVSDFYNLSFRTHKGCGSYICLRCRYRLVRVEEELNYKENLKRDILNSSQILKPLPDVFISLYDFDTFEEDELPFQRGDHFHELKEGEEYENWMFALNLSTGLKGYIPRLYVSRHGGEFNTQIWFQDVDSKHAEEILTTPFNKKGSFLVRRTPDLPGERAKFKHDNEVSLMVHQAIVDRMQNSYVLSVLQTDPDELKPQVLHFKIHHLKNGFYRLPNLSETFSSIPKLVDYYKTRGSGLPHRLTTPCVRVKPPIPFRGFQVRRKDISVNLNRNSKEYLGDGSVGEVYFGLQRKITKIAVKKLKRQTDLKKFVPATTAISKLNHRRLVQLLGVCTESEPYLIITEYMANGPLPSFLKQHKERIKLHFIIKTAIQITDGMNYLETQPYVHRNLRAANIMLGDRNQVKISDFGISGILLDATDISSGNIKTFPELWTAPEALFDNNYTSKSDVWSFGVLLYEMITFSSILPYAELRKEVTDELKLKDSGDDALTMTCMERIRDGYRLTQPEECSDEYYSAMLDCWNEEPEQRPSFAYWYHFFENYELPEVEDEMASTPSDADLTDLTTGPGYTQPLFVDSSGYGSFENKYKSSASRTSSRMSFGMKPKTISASRASSGASFGNLSSRKPSFDFQNGGLSSRDESQMRGLVKSSKTTADQIEKDIIDIEEKPATGDQQDNIEIGGRESTTILKEIIPQEASKIFDTELTDEVVKDTSTHGTDLQKNLNEESVHEEKQKTPDDLQKVRKTATPAVGAGQTTSRLSKKATESRATNVNSVAKKGTKSVDTVHKHNTGKESRVGAKSKTSRAPTVQSTIETKETPIFPIERPVSLLQKRNSIVSKGGQPSTEDEGIKTEDKVDDTIENFEDKVNQESKETDTWKDNETTEHMASNIGTENEDSNVGKVDDNIKEKKDPDTKEVEDGIKQENVNSLDNEADPAQEDKDEEPKENGISTLEKEKNEETTDKKDEIEVTKDSKKNENETSKTQNKKVNNKGAKSTTPGVGKSKGPTPAPAKSTDKKNAKTSKETDNVKTKAGKGTTTANVKQQDKEKLKKDKEPENKNDKKADNTEDEMKSENKENEDGNVGKENQDSHTDIDKTTSKTDLKGFENETGNQTNPTGDSGLKDNINNKTNAGEVEKEDPTSNTHEGEVKGDKGNGDDVEKDIKSDVNDKRNENEVFGNPTNKTNEESEVKDETSDKRNEDGDEKENFTNKTRGESDVKQDSNDKGNVDEEEKKTKSDVKKTQNEKKDKNEKSTTEKHKDKTTKSNSSTQPKDGSVSKMSKTNEKSGSVNSSNKGSKTSVKQTGKKK